MCCSLLFCLHLHLHLLCPFLCLCPEEQIVADMRLKLEYECLTAAVALLQAGPSGPATPAASTQDMTDTPAVFASHLPSAILGLLASAELPDAKATYKATGQLPVGEDRARLLAHATQQLAAMEVDAAWLKTLPSASVLFADDVAAEEGELTPWEEAWEQVKTKWMASPRPKWWEAKMTKAELDMVRSGWWKTRVVGLLLFVFFCFCDSLLKLFCSCICCCCCCVLLLL